MNIKVLISVRRITKDGFKKARFYANSRVLQLSVKLKFERRVFMSKGRIVKVEYIRKNIVYLQQGVKQRNQRLFANKYPGGNGTYVLGGETVSCINIKIFVYDLNKCYTFDIKDKVLYANARKRVSTKLIKFLEQNEGKKVDVCICGKNVIFNPEDLPFFIYKTQK